MPSLKKHPGEFTDKGAGKAMDASGNAKKPSAITAVQILLYLAALVNVVNGFLAIGDTGIVKKIVSAAMILIGTAALWQGFS